ncbi:SMP-30/gluconolactonase/LRE family protein [Mesorhizobium sp.]|uniref:SMP-30/gluconolactonase/LRE family protein n=1 Tax=Mesorhizobium sp. TaxID=1871066 RepID=UPI0025ECE6B9|nr:SMP-30/gluconolactonase/LRE family protein [Mesorhizobium sp.]
MKIEVVVDVKTTLGEGPLWDVEQERLYWIDSFDGRVFRATADGREIRCWDVPMKIGCHASPAMASCAAACSPYPALASKALRNNASPDDGGCKRG